MRTCSRTELPQPPLPPPPPSYRKHAVGRTPRGQMSNPASRCGPGMLQRPSRVPTEPAFVKDDRPQDGRTVIAWRVPLPTIVPLQQTSASGIERPGERRQLRKRQDSAPRATRRRCSRSCFAAARRLNVRHASDTFVFRPCSMTLGGHEILPGGGRVTARVWPTELLVGGRWFCPR